MQSSSDDLQVIYVAADVFQAQLLAGALEEQGIDAVVGNAELQAAIGRLPPGDMTAPKLLVRARDAERARALVLDMEQRLVATRDDAQPDRAAFQFTIQALLVLTTGVAIYFGVNRAIVQGGGESDNPAAIAAVCLFAWMVFFVACFRKLQARRLERR